MGTNEEYIEQLMSEKVAGIISKEDDQYLQALMNEHPLIAQAWEEYQGRFADIDIQKAEQINWKTLVTKTSAKRRYITIAAAAAAITGIIFSVIILNGREHKVTTAHVVQLQLSSGKKIDLSSSNTHIQLDGAQLSNAGKSLSYTATETAAQGLNKLTVPSGMDYTIKLDDGTTVRLNAATRLEFPFKFNGKTREIKIEGEAYLDVAKDASRPFIVHTGNSTIKVLGTTFNINNYDSASIKVSLVNGAVAMMANSQSLILKPGMQGIYSNNNLQQQPFMEDRELSWLKGSFYFTDANLEHICRVLTRWYGKQVIMDRNEAGKERFTGRIDKDEPVTGFLEKLKMTTAVDYYFDKDSVLHFK